MNRVGRGLRGFGAFWWDFIVGDDWVIAVGVVLALAATALIAHADVAAAWAVLPVVTAVMLAVSLHRATRRP